MPDSHQQRQSIAETESKGLTAGYKLRMFDLFGHSTLRHVPTCMPVISSLSEWNIWILNLFAAKGRGCFLRVSQQQSGFIYSASDGTN